jgi:hypothetical protein
MAPAYLPRNAKTLAMNSVPEFNLSPTLSQLRPTVLAVTTEMRVMKLIKIMILISYTILS